jgi:hypothetical protein
MIVKDGVIHVARRPGIVAEVVDMTRLIMRCKKLGIFLITGLTELLNKWE